MKDSTKMKGSVVGHYGEDIKVGPKTQSVLFPNLGELLIRGYSNQKDGYELEIFGGPYSGITLILSENNGFIKPLEFQYQDGTYCISAKETDEKDDIIINLQQKQF